MKDNSFGNLISKLRKEKGLTQKDLAENLNISDKAISRWETGKSFPDLEMIFLISKYFQVPFNDFLKVRMEEKDQDNDVVQNVINEFTKMNKNHKRILKIVLGIASIIVLILITVVIFTLTFNRFKVYKVGVENSEVIGTNGIYVETRIKDTLQLTNIELRGKKLNADDSISVDIYFLENGHEKIIQNYSSLYNIYFTNFESYIEINDLSKYIDNLYLRVTIIDKDNKITKYDTKLKFTLDFSNNKIYYKETNEMDRPNLRQIDLSKEEIKNILLENGFKEGSGLYLIKYNKEFNANYYIDLYKLSFDYKKDNINYRYTYILNIARLEVEVYSKNNTMIEKYTYDANLGQVTECVVGSCNDYIEAMYILDENVLNYLYNN